MDSALHSERGGGEEEEREQGGKWWDGGIEVSNRIHAWPFATVPQPLAPSHEYHLTAPIRPQNKPQILQESPLCSADSGGQRLDEFSQVSEIPQLRRQLHSRRGPPGPPLFTFALPPVSFERRAVAPLLQQQTAAALSASFTCSPPLIIEAY